MVSFFSIKNLKSRKKVMQSIFSMSNFKSSFFGIKNFKTVRVSFFSIKNLKIRKKVMQSFFSMSNFKSSFFGIKNFKSRKKVMELFCQCLKTLRVVM